MEYSLTKKKTKQNKNQTNKQKKSHELKYLFVPEISRANLDYTLNFPGSIRHPAHHAVLLCYRVTTLTSKIWTSIKPFQQRHNRIKDISPVVYGVLSIVPVPCTTGVRV